MRVLLATPWLHPGGGGLERYARTLGLHFAQAGHDVTLLGHSDEPRYEFDGEMRVVGVAPKAQLSNTPVSLGIHRAARRILRAAPHDIVNVHTPVPGTAELVALAARRSRVPYVVTYHAGRLGAPPGVLSLAANLHRHVFERSMIARAAGRIAVSPYVAERVFGRHASDLIPPGVDAERFRPLARPVPGRILYVGGVSRAYAWKGLGTLVKAFERLAPFHKEAHLRIVGTGDLVEHYARRALHKQLDERVTFVGRVEDDALAREYSEASVVVLPSITDAESFGMVLAEANACERPVIGSDIGGIPFFVRDGENGLLAPPGDAHALSSAIANVLSDPRAARAMGRAGRERVVQEHRWETLAQRTLEAFQQAATRRRGLRRARSPGSVPPHRG